MNPLQRNLVVGLIAFCLVGAGLTHFLAVSQAGRTWPDSDQTVRSTARDARVFDPATSTELTAATLHRSTAVRVVGGGIDGATIYETSTQVETSTGSFISRDRWTGLQADSSGAAVSSAFNRVRTTELTSSGDELEQTVTLPHLAGQLSRFPVDTPRRSLLVWDPLTRQATTASFQRAGRLLGRDVLIFRQTVPATLTGRLESTAASSLRGVITSVQRTMWVRPELGIIVRSRTHVMTRLAVDDGAGDSDTLLDASFEDDAQDVRRLSADADAAHHQKIWLETIAPAVILLLGTLGGLMMMLFRSRSGRRGVGGLSVE